MSNPFVAFALAAFSLLLAAPQQASADFNADNITFNAARSELNYAVLMNLGAKGSPYLPEVSQSFARVVGHADLQRAIRAYLQVAGQPEMQSGYIGSTIRKSVEGLCNTLDKNTVAVIPWAIMEASTFWKNKTSGSFTILHLWFKAVSPSCLFNVNANNASNASSALVPIQFVAVTTDGMIIWADCPADSKVCHFFGSFTLSAKAASRLRRSLKDDSFGAEADAVAPDASSEAEACNQCSTNLVACGSELLDAGIKCSLDAVHLTQGTCSLDLCGSVKDKIGATIQCTECLSYKTTGKSIQGLVVSTLDSLISTVISEGPKWVKKGMDAFFGLFV